MTRAGTALARLALALAPHARDIEVWCGPGNNGGDGLVAARWLHAQGEVRARDRCRATPRAPRPTHDKRCKPLAMPACRCRPRCPTGVQADLAIDALLGIGGSRELDGRAGPMPYRALNAGHAPVLAVDVPSGLHADTGALLGSDAVRATHTLSLLTLKPGLLHRRSVATTPAACGSTTSACRRPRPRRA